MQHLGPDNIVSEDGEDCGRGGAAGHQPRRLPVVRARLPRARARCWTHRSCATRWWPGSRRWRDDHDEPARPEPVRGAPAAPARDGAVDRRPGRPDARRGLLPLRHHPGAAGRRPRGHLARRPPALHARRPRGRGAGGRPGVDPLRRGVRVGPPPHARPGRRPARRRGLRAGPPRRRPGGRAGHGGGQAGRRARRRRRPDPRHRPRSRPAGDPRGATQPAWPSTARCGSTTTPTAATPGPSATSTRT